MLNQFYKEAHLYGKEILACSDKVQVSLDEVVPPKQSWSCQLLLWF